VSLLQRARDSLGALDPQSQPVLVVEDDAGLRAYLVTILEHHGYRVLAAASGEEALELLGDQRALLAVLDVGLPGIDGFAIVETLPPDVPVIVVTADPLRAKMKAFGRPANMTVLTKPVAPEDFERAVAAAL
jgi:two-component system, OmpR family, response regulator TctD